MGNIIKIKFWFTIRYSNILKFDSILVHLKIIIENNWDP